MSRCILVPATILLTLCCNPLLGSVSVDFSEYCPLQTGKRWILQDERGNQYEYYVAGTEALGGEVTFQYTNWEGNPGYYNLTYECGALKILGINGQILDPPRIYNGQDIDNASVHIVYDIEPVVDTPAGSFNDVIKQIFYSKAYGQERKTRVRYYALDVGLVRDEEWSAEAGGTYVYTASLVSYEKRRNWVSMFGLNTDCQDAVASLYLHDLSSGDFRVVKEDCNEADAFGSLNVDGTRMVYGVTSNQENTGWIRIYDVQTRSHRTARMISDCDWDLCAYFDANDLIVFNDRDGRIKTIQEDGQDVGTVVTSEEPYRFSVFWISPDRKRIAAIENQHDSDYETSNFERLVVFNADGSDRRVLLGPHLGEWNFVSWKPDSSGLIFYYHTFNGQPWPLHVSYARYMTFDLTQDPPGSTDLSNSDLGSEEENVCYYTRTGNLLSITRGQLYDPYTGALLADCAENTASLFTGGIVGSDIAGGIYFADPNGENLREFRECECHTMDSDYFEGFESNSFSSLWQHGGDVPWTVTTSQAHNGSYCAQAGTIGDSQSSTLQLDYPCADGEVGFFVKVSSESGWDELSFWVDGVFAGQWSGEVDWSEVIVPVVSGNHTFEWVYHKDGSLSGGADTAWIDDVTLPASR